MRVPETSFPLGFVLIEQCGYLLYVLPSLLLVLYLASSKLTVLQKAIVPALIASGLLLIYSFTTYLLVVPFLPWGIQIDAR